MSEVINAVEAATEVVNQTTTKSGGSKYNKFGWGALAGVGATLLIEAGVMGVCKLVDGKKKPKTKKTDDEEQPKKKRKPTKAKAKPKTQPEEDLDDEDFEDDEEE